MGCLFRDWDAVIQASTSFTMYLQHMRRLERFTVLMYSKNCESDSACIISTCKAFTAHCRIYMESVSCPKIRKSLNRVNGVGNGITEPWVPYLTDMPDATHGCSILLHCGCSVACKGNCKGFRAGIRCSQLCKCDGGCTNNVTWSWTVNRTYQELFLVFRIFPNLKGISSCSLCFTS